jgi:hypothetical protein
MQDIFGNGSTNMTIEIPGGDENEEFHFNIPDIETLNNMLILITVLIST